MEEQACQRDAGIPGPISTVWGDLKLYEVLVTALPSEPVIGCTGKCSGGYYLMAYQVKAHLSKSPGYLLILLQWLCALGTFALTGPQGSSQIHAIQLQRDSGSCMQFGAWVAKLALPLQLCHYRAYMQLGGCKWASDRPAASPMQAQCWKSK